MNIKLIKGFKLQPIKELAKIHNVSIYRMTNHIHKLQDLGIIDKYNNKFFCISNNDNNDIKIIQYRLIQKAKINLKIVKFLNNKNMIYDTMHMTFIEDIGNTYILHYPLLNNYQYFKKDDPQHIYLLYANNLKPKVT